MSQIIGQSSQNRFNYDEMDGNTQSGSGDSHKNNNTKGILDDMGEDEFDDGKFEEYKTHSKSD